MTEPLELFKDFSYRPEIYWDDAQYHHKNCYLNGSAQLILVLPQDFEILQDRLGSGLREGDSY